MLDSTLWWWVLLAIAHIALQSRFLKAWPDWDTSNHLYFAFLRNKGVSFKSSYGPGIKWAVPRLYEVIWPILDKNPGRFRLLNTFGGVAFLALLAWMSEGMNPHTIGVFVAAVLFLNAGYVNPVTSASEFLSVPIALITIFFIPSFLPWPFDLYFQTVVVVLLAWGFKIVELAWLLPIGIQHWQTFLETPLFVIPAALFALAGLYVLLKNQVTRVGSYTSNRGFFHPKNVDFISRNFLFVSLMLATTAVNFWYGGAVEKSLLLAVWTSVIAQRTFVFYFWQGPLMTNLLLTAQSEWIQFVPLSAVWGLNAIVFFLLVAPMLWSARSIYPDGHIRRLYTGSGYRKAQIMLEEEQVDWLKSNVKETDCVYLWGSKVSLLLQARLSHLSNTYYNHNHLFFWSSIEDKVGYAIETIRQRKPDFVIEAAVINNEHFPQKMFADSYRLMKQIDTVKIFKRVSD